MPINSAAVTETSTVSITFVDTRGQKRAVNLEAQGNDTQAMAIINAIANASNAGVLSYRKIEQGDIRITSVEAYDEAESSVNTVGILVYRDANNGLRYVEIPAPDASMFDATGDALDTGNTLVSAIKTAVEASNTDWDYERSFIASRKGTKSRVSVKPGAVQEPDTGDLPPSGPGEDPTP